MTQALTAPALPPLSAISSPLLLNLSLDAISILAQLHANAARGTIHDFRVSIMLFGNKRRFALVPSMVSAIDKVGEHLLNGRILLPLLLLASACKPPPDPRQAIPLASAERGKAAIERVGCAACHTIEGIAWPRGGAAPNLGGISGRALIAGQLPNRPAVVAAFVRDAPALVRGTAMPSMPLSEREARDVAAYLYSIGG